MQSPWSMITLRQLSNGKRKSVENLFLSLAKKRGLNEKDFQPGFLQAEEEKIQETKNKTNNNDEEEASKFSTWKEIFT